MLRTKKSLLRQTAFSCCLSALLGGISELPPTASATRWSAPTTHT